jgi:hypothetical protein
MWGLLPAKTRTVAAVIGALIVMALRLGFSVPPSSAFGWLELLLSSAGITAAVGLAVGRFRPAWRVPCFLGLKWWYPDLNGVWQGTAKTVAPGEKDYREFRIEVTIDQRWVGVSVSTHSLESPLRSGSVFVAPVKEEGKAVLWTNFIAEQEAPAESDERSWHGSSRLIYDRKARRLSGIYWTDRAAHILKTGGTAGTLALQRMR